MIRHTGNVSKSVKVMQNDYLNERTISTKHTMTQHGTTYPMFPPEPNAASDISVDEHKKLSGVRNMEQPGLTSLKNHKLWHCGFIPWKKIVSWGCQRWPRFTKVPLGFAIRHVTYWTSFSVAIKHLKLTTISNWSPKKSILTAIAISSVRKVKFTLIPILWNNLLEPQGGTYHSWFAALGRNAFVAAFASFGSENSTKANPRKSPEDWNLKKREWENVVSSNKGAKDKGNK